MMTMSRTQSSNVLRDDEPSAGDIESDMSDDLFANGYGSDMVDDLFMNDLPSDVNESFPPPQNPDDLHLADSNLLAADDDDDCPLSSSRVRVRSDFCAKEGHMFDVRTNEDVQKYWCSQIIVEGFASIPVCNLWLEGATFDVQSSIATLQICRLSRFIPVERTHVNSIGANEHG